MINITSNSPNYFYNSRTKLGKKNICICTGWRLTAQRRRAMNFFKFSVLSFCALMVLIFCGCKQYKVSIDITWCYTSNYVEKTSGISLMARNLVNWLAVKTILPAWFDHLQDSLSYKAVQFKMFCPLVKIAYHPAEKVNKTPSSSLEMLLSWRSIQRAKSFDIAAVEKIGIDCTRKHHSSP